MSKLPFVCLNVEPESDDDEEIDNTAEIKLEEALKLYQQALRLHAQGPSQFAEAQEAYDELFQNEIFTYDEALSVRKREAVLGEESTDSDDDSSSSETDQEFELDGMLEPLPPSVEGAPSTLRQVVYLSYKNYGQFQLDRLQHDLVEKGVAGLPWSQLEPNFQKRISSRVRKALDSFSDALDKDDTDIDLWRQASRLTALLGSKRLSRFCLEAVTTPNEIDSAADGQNFVVDIVLEDLKELYGQIGDDASNEHISAIVGERTVPLRIRTALDPCARMPKIADEKAPLSLSDREAKIVRLKISTWSALGKQIIRLLKSGAPATGEFDTMCTGYHIEKVAESLGKSEEGRVKRRRTIEGADAQRNDQSQTTETNILTVSVEGSQSPVQTPASPKSRRMTAELQQVRSPPQENVLPMRGLLTEDAKSQAQVQDRADNSPVQDRRNPLKRSPEAAGMAQEPPEARSRSKRLRARETGLEDDFNKDQRQQIERQLKLLKDADRHLFKVSDTLLNRLGVSCMSNPETRPRPATGAAASISQSQSHDLSVASEDFTTSLKGWNSNKSSLLLHGTGAGATATLISKGNDAGLANFLEHAKSGHQASRDSKDLLIDQDLDQFIDLVNGSWFSIDELALAWLSSLLGPHLAGTDGSEDAVHPKYVSTEWNADLKSVVHEILSLTDSYVFDELEHALLTWSNGRTPVTEDGDLAMLMALVQALFEIQLDTYDAMIKPTSKVDQPTRILQRARLQRWAFLSSQAIAKRSSAMEESDTTDPIALRHLFSMTLYLSMDEDSSREHIISCLQEVKFRIDTGHGSAFGLPNIDIMPEISMEAVDQEISRLTTTDFFMSVFSPSDDDPVATIESLEPIIMPFSRDANDSGSQRSSGSSRTPDAGKPCASPSRQLVDKEQSPVSPDSQRDQLLDFLSKSTASLRLSLWNRLTNAYSAIDAPAFVFLCTIHSMNIVLSELETSVCVQQPENTRMSNLLIWMRNLIDLIDKCCVLSATDPTVFDCMDEDNIQLALGSVTSCVRLFHLFALWDDRMRVGQAGPPPQQTGGANALKQVLNLFRETQLKIWQLLYLLIREAAAQNTDLFPDVNDDLLHYIAAVHSAIGLREYCKLGKKSFVKFVKTELLSLQPNDLHEWRYQMAQVAYDLYDLRVLADSDTWMTLQEHNCNADQLDRATAREILPMVMAQIRGINVKEITKPDRRDFKQAIDKIQDLIGSPKASSVQQSFNRKQLLAFQKTPIRGSDLTNALRGIGGLTNMPVKNEYSVIAKTGWYFVIGYLRLASFRSVKRTGPDSTKELDEAMTYLKFDIDFDCEKWETWYRLAQAYDAMLDEEVTWTADRINNKMDDLVALQRQSIHCYQIAVALLVRQNNSDSVKFDDMALTISELYSDFGKRLYASSRPPFDLRAFSVDDHLRWFFTHLQVKFRDKPFQPMTAPAVWLVASVLFREALAYRENDWHNWYMLGKCLWKLLGHEDVGGLAHEQVLGAFAKACEVSPNKDARHPEKGPVLEPHHKLVSTVHKMVSRRKLLTPEQGYQWLKKTPYIQTAELKEPMGKQEWSTLVRHVVRNLRAADKANWHHRIMARAASMAFEDPGVNTPAEAAISQYTPHIFTKTMVVQVWRTLYERAGRHFVFTTKYVNTFIDLLTLAGDRVSLEALGKKVRKKQAEFIDHLAIWTRICKEHVKLLRAQSDVPTLHEERVLFVLPYERFVPNAALLQTWAQPANAEPPAHPLLIALREAIDLKKLNLNLIPNQGIDDLIGDAYAKLYEEMVPGLVANATNEKNREAMRVDRILMGDPGADDRADTGTESAVPLTNPSGRAKIVGRMEVRRRAEALVQRLATGQGAVKGKATALAEAAAAQEEDEEEEETGDHGEELTAAPSPDANNDADDESELSELDEEPQDALGVDEDAVHDATEVGNEGRDDDEVESKDADRMDGDEDESEPTEDQRSPRSPAKNRD